MESQNSEVKEIKISNEEQTIEDYQKQLQDLDFQVQKTALLNIYNSVETKNFENIESISTLIPSIFPFLRSLDSECKLKTLTLFGILVKKNEKYKTILRDLGFFDILMNLYALFMNSVTNKHFEANDLEMMTQICSGIVPFCTLDKDRQVFIQSGAVEVSNKLLTSLNAEQLKLKFWVLNVLKCLSNQEETVLNKLMKLETMKWLMLDFQDCIKRTAPDEEIAGILECISVFEQSEPMRNQFVAMQGIKMTLTVIDRKNVNVQTFACFSLANSLVTEDAISQFNNLDGLSKIYQFISAEEEIKEKLVEAACCVVTKICQKKELGLEAMKHGIIPVLALLERKMKTKSIYAVTKALDTLLNHDATLKYWIRNRIDQTDYINNGFLDLGSACDPTTTLFSIEELQKHSLNLKKEILLVDREKDPGLAQWLHHLVDQLAHASKSEGKPIEELIKLMIKTIDQQMGGHTSYETFRFHLAELKITAGTNLLYLGSLKKTSAQHRSLIFKIIFDDLKVKLGLDASYGCSIERQKFGRVQVLVHRPQLEPINVSLFQ